MAITITAARMQSEGTIAIVEDDVAIRTLVSDFLVKQGYETESYGCVADFNRGANPARLDCLILDLMLPGESGLVLCRQLAVTQPHLPILMVTAKGDEIDRIIGLECGADDYLPKPFNSRELIARLRAILRRTRSGAKQDSETRGESYHFAGWRLCVTSRNLTSPDGNAVRLSPGEFDLLHALVTHPRRVLSRDFLLDTTRGRDATPFDRAVDVQLCRLRRKLGEDPRRPSMIRTLRGDGYLFEPSVQRA